jgi:AcrR family transcriptional regulator
MSVASRRKREREERRQVILDAAKKLFFAKGFEETRMDEVAAEAELSKGTLYLYFKNKDDLVLALSAEVLGSAIEALEAIFTDDSLDGLDCITRMMATYGDHAVAHQRQFRTAAVWIASGYQVDTTAPCFAKHRAQIERILELWVMALQRGLDDQSIRADVSPMETAVQLWGGLFGIIQVRINFDEIQRRVPKAVERDALIPGYIDIVRAGLRAEVTK